MRIVVISDVHLGPSPWYFGANRLMAEEAAALFPQIIEEIRTIARPDIIMQLGDLIHENMKSPSKDEDMGNYKRALAHLASVQAPVYHALGNHDLVTLTTADYRTILGYENPYYSFDFKGNHFIVLYSDCAGHCNMTISQQQVSWLEKDLQKTALPTFVFIHHPLIEQPLENHYWFKGRPDKAFVQNASEMRQILFDSQKVKLVCNGHMHENRYTVVKNIPFITVQGVCENVADTGVPSGCYTIIDVAKDQIEVQVRGNDPAYYLFRTSVPPLNC